MVNWRIKRPVIIYAKNLQIFSDPNQDTSSSQCFCILEQTNTRFKVALKSQRGADLIRAPTSRFFSARSTLNSFWKQNRFRNRFFLQLFWATLFFIILAFFKVSSSTWTKFEYLWLYFTQMSCHTPQFKRIDSLKKELPIHNSLEKRLKESILQLSTPESLGLYNFVHRGALLIFFTRQTNIFLPQT